MYNEFGDDPELAMAIKMSMIEEEVKRAVVPEEPAATDPQAVTVQFRLPDNSKLLRRFNFEQHKASDAANFVKRQTGKLNVKLSTAGFPRKLLDDGARSLRDYGITKNETLIVEFK